MNYKALALTFLASSLTACGSGKVPVGSTLSFTNSPSIAVAENSSEVMTLAATGSTTVSFTVNGGMDAAFFEIGTGAKASTLSFKAAPDFEDPQDDGKNNGYLVNITATAGTDTVDALLTVNVTDVVELKSALNDTGITLCGFNAAVAVACDGSSPQGQDALYGRDKVVLPASKVGAGAAGFDFTKLAADGGALADQTVTDHPCVKDNHTGLTWEVKQASGLHNKDNTYTWYSTDATSNGGSAGTENTVITCEAYVGGTASSYCNTQAFVARVNASNGGAGLCAGTDWRLPTIDELQNIEHLGASSGPYIDTTYFPQTQNNTYWSSAVAAYSTPSSVAWVAYFNGEGDTVGGLEKNTPHFVRLVRGGQ